MFDADQFMSTSTEGAMDTEFTPVPEGEYQAVVKSIKPRESGEYVILDVTWAIDDAEVSEVTGLDNPTVRQSIFLDMTENGGLDMSKGKNIGLGRLRDAVNQNTGGAWSPAMLEGQVAKVRVSHRLYEGRTYTDVKGVAKV